MLLAIPNFIMYDLDVCGEPLISKFQKIYYTTLLIVHKKSYEDLLLMNDGISIHQNHLHFLTTEIFKSVNNLNLQFMRNYFSVQSIIYELRKGNAFFSRLIDLLFLFCGSLLGNTLHPEIKESNSTEVAKSKLRETFLAPVLCFDKYQRNIQTPVGFNSFKILTICAISYFLEAWRVSEYPPEYYYMKRINWCFFFCFFLLVGFC